MTPQRKAEVLRVREEGRNAALAGRHKQTNPYPTYDSNHGQWLRGWYDGDSEASQ